MDTLNVDTGRGQYVEIGMDDSRRDWLFKNWIIEKDPDYEGDYRLCGGPQKELATMLLLIGEPA